MIVAQRLGKGSCGSPRGAGRLVADALKVVGTLSPGRRTGKPLVRMDSASYGHGAVSAAIRGGPTFSVTVWLRGAEEGQPGGWWSAGFPISTRAVLSRYST